MEASLSQVSTAYDNFVSRVDAVLTSANGWIKLPHAYAIEKNPEIYLKQGYAIGISSGTNTKRLLSKTISINRQFSLTISRALDLLDLEVGGRQTIEKQLFEDLKLVIADIEGNQTLNSGEIFCQYESDGGIEYVDGETAEFAIIRAVFSLEYYEQF